MRTTTAAALVSFALFALANADDQPRIKKWTSTPPDGCEVDCSAITTKRECAKEGKRGRLLLGEAGCCMWDADTKTCSDRPCSWFDEKNCNSAPHCGWQKQTDDSYACANRVGCEGMFKKTCDKYFQYCRWQPDRIAPSGDIGECGNLPIPTPARVSDDSACFGMPAKACKWWMNQKNIKYPGQCVYTGKWGCENLQTINEKCWWTTKGQCEGAIRNGFSCNWNKKLQKCTRYEELRCFELVGWTPDNAMTTKAARRSCCSTQEIGDDVRGAAGTKCTKPKLGNLKYNDCRWCEDHEDSARCVKAKNCPTNVNI